jgi:hypothetical protein
VDSISQSDGANDIPHIDYNDWIMPAPSITSIPSNAVLNMMSSSTGLISNNSSTNCSNNSMNALFTSSPLVPPAAYYMPTFPQPPK